MKGGKKGGKVEQSRDLKQQGPAPSPPKKDTLGIYQSKGK